MKTKQNQNLGEGLKNRPEPLSTGQRPRINFALRRRNRALNTEKLLHLLWNQAPKFFAMAEVVGKWVWIQFSERQPVKITRALAELGFHWNNRRQLWQHPCGMTFRERASFDPRQRYGSYFPAAGKRA